MQSRGYQLFPADRRACRRHDAGFVAALPDKLDVSLGRDLPRDFASTANRLKEGKAKQYLTTWKLETRRSQLENGYETFGPLNRQTEAIVHADE